MFHDQGARYLPDRSRVPACRHGPIIQCDLIFANPCRAPLRIGRKAFDGFYVIVKNVAIHRHRIFNTHDKLNIELARYPTVRIHFHRMVNMA